MTSIEDILKKAKLPEHTVTLCLREDLVAEYERLDTQLRTAPAATTSLAEVSPRRAIAERMDALRTEMLEHQVPFLLRALPAREFVRLREAMPDKGKNESDDEFTDRWHLAICGMVSRICVDPVMTPDQVDELSKSLSEAQWRDLTDGAWNLNNRGQAIPLSVAASAALASSEQS